MSAVIVAAAVVSALAFFVVRWTERDYVTVGSLTTRSKLGMWLLYVFHADVVGSAAWAAALPLTFVPVEVGLVLGIGLLLAGSGLFLWSSAALAGSLQRGERLVTAGPFALMRHPQNVGWVLMLVGVSVSGRSALALLLVAPFTLIAARLGAVEERYLARRFGDAWGCYRAATPAVWLRVGRIGEAGRA